MEKHVRGNQMFWGRKVNHQSVNQFLSSKIPFRGVPKFFHNHRNYLKIPELQYNRWDFSSNVDVREPLKVFFSHLHFTIVCLLTLSCWGRLQCVWRLKPPWKWVWQWPVLWLNTFCGLIDTRQKQCVPPLPTRVVQQSFRFMVKPYFVAVKRNKTPLLRHAI